MWCAYIPKRSHRCRYNPVCIDDFAKKTYNIFFYPLISYFYKICGFALPLTSVSILYVLLLATITFKHYLHNPFATFDESCIQLIQLCFWTTLDLHSVSKYSCCWCDKKRRKIRSIQISYVVSLYALPFLPLFQRSYHSIHILSFHSSYNILSLNVSIMI